MNMEMVKSFLKKISKCRHLPLVLKNLKECPIPEGEAVFGVPEFRYPSYDDLRRFQVTIHRSQIPLLISVQQKIQRMELSSIHGMTASKQGGQLFSRMVQPREHQPLQSAAEAEALLDQFLSRHKNSGLHAVKETWSGRVWVDNIDGSHRLSAVAEANTRLNLNLCLYGIQMRIYDFNRQIRQMTPDHFRLILPEAIAEALAQIPNIKKFVDIYDLCLERNWWMRYEPINKLVVGELRDSEFEIALREKLTNIKCGYLRL